MSMSSGIANWHWRTKDVRPWAKDWLKDQVTKVSSEHVKINDLSELIGDCEVGMRKSKVITIYDLKVVTTWSGTLNETEASGTLTCLELSHDMDEDEYQFECSLDSGSGADADALRNEARKQVADKLRPIFQNFTPALVDAHGKDLLVDTSASNSGASTPATTKSTSNTPATTTTTTQQSTTKSNAPAPSINTTTVEKQSDFQISGDDLFDLLTNEQKVPMWTRNPAKIRPEVDAEVSLFGGNIIGKVLSVNKPTDITTSWRAPTWPEGHFGTLKMTLTQGSSSTNLSLVLQGVPSGTEEETERNLDVYYFRSLKQLGSGPFPPSSKTTTTTTDAARNKSKTSRHTRKKRKQNSNNNSFLFKNGTTLLVGVAAVSLTVAAFSSEKVKSYFSTS